MDGLLSSNITGLVDLFGRLAAAHVDVAGRFVFGDEEDMKAWARSSGKYPMLFLEMPDESFEGRVTESVFDLGVAVFIQVSSLDADANSYGELPLSQAWAQSLEILHDIESKLRQMHLANKLVFDINTIKNTPVAYAPTADRLVGYRAAIRISYQASLCVDDSKWHS